MEKQWSDILRENPKMFRDTTVVHLFRLAREYAPDHAALTADGSTLTYEELDRQSSRAAGALLELGAEPGEILAIETGRHREAVTAFLAAWKIGCACLFIDRDCPESRNRECLKECGVRHEITREFIRHAADTRPDPKEGTFREPRPEDLAVIVYTSGSTGKPKGVMLTQRNLAASVSNFDEIGLRSADRYGCFASMMFIAAVFDLAAALCAGAHLCLIPAGIRRHIGEVAQFYRENGITVTFLPPLMAMKYQEMDEESPLRILLVGSEPVRNLSPASYRIINVYASSECCAAVCLYTIRDRRKWYPIGRPVSSVKAYIMGEDGNPVPAGETGELWLSGEQIADGYLNNPEATAEHFGTDPDAGIGSHAHLFRTGDLVALDPDGQMEYHGRMDDMVKIRGFRVELTGVEKWMNEYPGIEEACCVAFMDDGGTNILFGYYISQTEIDHEKLRAFLGQHVPYYMVPTGLIRRETFPRTRTGKVNRRGFEAPPEINDHRLAAERYR